MSTCNPFKTHRLASQDCYMAVENHYPRDGNSLGHQRIHQSFFHTCTDSARAYLVAVNVFHDFPSAKLTISPPHPPTPPSSPPSLLPSTTLLYPHLSFPPPLSFPPSLLSLISNLYTFSSGIELYQLHSPA